LKDNLFTKDIIWINTLECVGGYGEQETLCHLFFEFSIFFFPEV